MKIVSLDYLIRLCHTNKFAVASKFFEHFVLISDAMTYRAGEKEASLWNHEDGFYYDAISWGGPCLQYVPCTSLRSVHSATQFLPSQSAHFSPSSTTSKGDIPSGDYQVSFQSSSDVIRIFRSLVEYTLLHRGNGQLE